MKHEKHKLTSALYGILTAFVVFATFATPARAYEPPVHRTPMDRFVIARFRKVGPARYDVTYLTLQCPCGKVVQKRTFRNRVVLPYDAIDNVIITSCPPDILYLSNHPHRKILFWEGSLFNERYRHFSRHFDIRRLRGHLLWMGRKVRHKRSYLRMRLDQLCR